jgi:hypothetical protein
MIRSKRLLVQSNGLGMYSGWLFIDVKFDSTQLVNQRRHSTFSHLLGPSPGEHIHLDIRLLLLLELEGRPGGSLAWAHPTRGVCDRALREHRESQASLSSLFLFPSIGGGGQGCPRLRTSNEGLPRPRVPGAREQCGCPAALSPLTPLLPPPYNISSYG